MFQKIAIGLVVIIAAIASIACSGKDNCGNMCDPEWVESATIADYRSELAGGADPNAAGGLPLSRALFALGHVLVEPSFADAGPDVVQLLIDSGADPNLVPEDFARTTPLTLSVHTESAPTVEILLKSSVDSNIPDADGHTTLMVAARSAEYNTDFEGIASLLIAYGADIDAQVAEGSFAGMNPLLYAVLNETEKGVVFLLKNGANPNVIDVSGDTPLHFAANNANYQSYNIANLLLQYGARKDVVNGLNRTLCQEIHPPLASPIDEYVLLERRFAALLC